MTTRRASKGRRYTKAQRRTTTEGVVQEFEDVDHDVEGQHGDGAYFVYVRNIWSSIRADLDHQCTAYGLCQRDADGCKTRQNAKRDRQFFLSAKSIWSDWIDLAQARYGVGLRAAKCVRRGQARSGRGDRTWADRLDGRPSGFSKTMLASSVRLDHPGAIA